MPRTRIIATGAYAPDKVLTNADLEKMVDTTDEWIVDRTGIRERHIAAPEQAASDLAAEAAKVALKRAGLKARDLDMIILATVTPDMFFPSTACMLQKKIGARNAAAFDINAACSGFVYGLSVADAYIATKKAHKVLVVGSEVLSKFVDWTDRSTCVLFGDGAGAAVLVPTRDDRGIISTDLYSDGRMGDLIELPAGGSRIPVTEQVLKSGLYTLKMKGNETFKAAVKALAGLITNALATNGLSRDDMALLVPHQANIRIIQAAAKRARIPMDMVYTNVERYGNTSAASIPIAVDEALGAGRIKRDDYVLLWAFGSGLTWASALLKW